MKPARTIIKISGFTLVLFVATISSGLTSETIKSENAYGTISNFVMNPNKTCADNYKDCIDNVNIDNLVDMSKIDESYMDACNKTLQCTSMYFHCRMDRDNLTSSESPLEYPAAAISSFYFENPFEAFVQ